jgi:hypothetical protein
VDGTHIKLEIKTAENCLTTYEHGWTRMGNEQPSNQATKAMSETAAGMSFFQVGEFGLKREHPIPAQAFQEFHPGHAGQFRRPPGRKPAEFMEFHGGKHTHLAPKPGRAGLFRQ